MVWKGTSKTVKSRTPTVTPPHDPRIKHSKDMDNSLMTNADIAKLSAAMQKRKQQAKEHEEKEKSEKLV